MNKNTLRRLGNVKVGRDWQVQPIEVYFYQGDMYGWIHINLIVYGIKQTVWATAVFPPFDDLVRFLREVMLGVFPSEFDVEEEGPTKRFCAMEHPDHRLFRFRLTDPYAYPQTVFMDNLFEREQFVQAFYDDLIMFKETHFSEELWGDKLLYVSLEPLKKLLEQAHDE